jgi:hypothetical protein
MEVIVEQGGQCARCGMTMEEHKKKYKKSLGVHHKALFVFAMPQESRRDPLQGIDRQTEARDGRSAGRVSSQRKGYSKLQLRIRLVPGMRKKESQEGEVLPILP